MNGAGIIRSRGDMLAFGPDNLLVAGEYLTVNASEPFHLHGAL
jgi:hypothetical protein